MSMDLPPDHPSSWFDPLYRSAAGDPGAIPWANEFVCPWLLEFLGDHPGPGRAVVVGCGLGTDAEAVADAGYATVAFDISPTAVEWCRQRYPESDVDYRTADMFDPPEDLVGAADLVVEVRTIQSLSPLVRPAAVDAVRSLLTPGGRLLLVALGRSDGSVPTGPPWALSDRELRRFEREGLVMESGRVERGQFVRVYRRP